MPVINLVTYGQSYQYFTQIQDKLKACGLSTNYVPEMEYDFQVQGIKDPMSSKTFPLLREKFSYTHILIVKLVSLKDSKASFQYYTDYEKKQQERLEIPNNELQKSAILNFKIFSLEGMRLIYEMSVETSVNSMVFKDNKKGEQEVNLGNTGMATAKAITKGVKKIRKDCGCSH